MSKYGIAFMLLVFLFGCAEVFDSEAQAVRTLEQRAYANREFDRPNVQILYQFSDDPEAECIKRGLVLANFLVMGQTLNNVKVRGCAVTTEPCIVILSYSPTKLEVTEEKLHCKYGNFHRPERT